MNDSERLKWLKEIEKDIFVCSLESTFVEDSKSCAIHSAIEALENHISLEDIKAELLKELEKLKGNSGCDYFTNRTIENCIGTVAEILDKHIKENKQ